MSKYRIWFQTLVVLTALAAIPLALWPRTGLAQDMDLPGMPKLRQQPPAEAPKSAQPAKPQPDGDFGLRPSSPRAPAAAAQGIEPISCSDLSFEVQPASNNNYGSIQIWCTPPQAGTTQRIVFALNNSGSIKGTVREPDSDDEHVKPDTETVVPGRTVRPGEGASVGQSSLSEVKDYNIGGS